MLCIIKRLVKDQRSLLFHLFFPFNSFSLSSFFCSLFLNPSLSTFSSRFPFCLLSLMFAFVLFAKIFFSASRVWLVFVFFCLLPQTSLPHHLSNIASQLHINGAISACVGICCSDTNWELTGIDVLCLASELSEPYEEFTTKRLRHACVHTAITRVLKKIMKL